MTRILERDAVVVGVGISEVGRRTGNSGIDLTVAACTEAIADAGLTHGDVDGFASVGDVLPLDAAAALGVEPRWTATPVDDGGLLWPLFAAIRAVAAGEARAIVVYRTVLMQGGALVGSGERSGPAPDDPMVASSLEWIGPQLTAHAYAAPNWLAMHCRRHMHLYGTTKEQLGWLAINSRRNAALNPKAAYRDPITMDDYLSARPISDPLGLLDCDVPVDGAVAVVVTHRDLAPDLPNPALRVEAIGGAPMMGGSWDQRPDYPKMASVDAAAAMWARTDLRPTDLDVAELYDGFTFITLAWLEALGVCGDGEAGPFVEGATRIALDGELPVNTYGGQLSAGRLHGYWTLHEAALQLRGQAGERQVRDPEVAVVAVGGGPFAGCLLLTR